MCTITVTKKLMEKAKDFARKRMGLSEELYKRRGEKNVTKIEQDIITGAVAEGAVFNFLRRQKIKSTKPDFKIYKKKDKSFSADLKSGDYKLHVKAQTYESAGKYGASWLFQKQDKLFEEASENDLLVFCLVDGDFVSIEAIISAKEVVECGILKDPVVYRYQLTKKAIYLNDVIHNQEGGLEKWLQKLPKGNP